MNVHQLYYCNLGRISTAVTQILKCVDFQWQNRRKKVYLFHQQNPTSTGYSNRTWMVMMTMISAMMIITKYSLPTIDFATRYSARYSDFLLQPYSNPTRSQQVLLVGA